MFSPRVNLTRINEESIADIIPPTEVENSNMHHSEANQAFTRSHGSTVVDLNNVQDPQQESGADRNPAQKVQRTL